MKKEKTSVWVRLLILVACSVTGCASVPHVRSHPLIFPYLKSSINERQQFYDSHMIVVNKAAGIFTVDGQGKPLKDMQTYLDDEVPNWAYGNGFYHRAATNIDGLVYGGIGGTILFTAGCIALFQGDSPHAIVGVNSGLILIGLPIWIWSVARPDYEGVASYFNNWLRKQLDLLPWDGDK